MERGAKQKSGIQRGKRRSIVLRRFRKTLPVVGGCMTTRWVKLGPGIAFHMVGIALPTIARLANQGDPQRTDEIIVHFPIAQMGI